MQGSMNSMDVARHSFSPLHAPSLCSSTPFLMNLPNKTKLLNPVRAIWYQIDIQAAGWPLLTV